jgi:hypothetical protein
MEAIVNGRTVITGYNALAQVGTIELILRNAG